MMEYFSRAMAYIFHPLLMPLLGIYMLFEMPTFPVSLYRYDALYHFPDGVKIRIYIVMGVLTFAAPLLSLLIMYWNKMISSLHMEKREDRVYPFFIVSLYYLLAYVFVAYQWEQQLQHPAFVGFLFGTLIVFVITFILNFWIKISLHAVGIFGVLALLIAYNQSQIPYFADQKFPNFMFILFFSVISGLVVTTRLYLKVHTLKEVLAGMVIGFGGIYICVKYGIYI